MDGDVLLTGATGYLGRHLLRALLEETDGRVHCLVRAPGEAAAVERIRKSLGLTGGCADLERLGIVRGDLALPRLGLSTRVWNGLASGTSRIYHVGASVNHLSSYESLREPNVRGTVELLRLAAAERVKEMHFVSSIDVVPHAGAPCPESMRIELPPEGIEGYGGTKWVADQLVAQAGARGLPVWIYRTGYIGPHSSGIDSNAAGWIELFLATMFKLRCVPDDLRIAPLTPVDIVAESIRRLSLAACGPQEVFHLLHREREVTRETLVAAAAELGEELEIAPRRAWRERLAAYGALHPTDPAGLLGPYLDDTGEHGPLGEGPLPAVRCDRAAAMLGGMPEYDPVDLVVRFVRSQVPVSDASGEERRGA